MARRLAVLAAPAAVREVAVTYAPGRQAAPPWRVTVYRWRPPHSTSGSGATLDEALDRVEDLEAKR